MTTFGRDAEVRDACAAFAAGARVVTLTGPGGIGKSRAAREIARAMASAFAGGIVNAALAKVGDGGSLARSLARGAPRLVVFDDADAVIAPLARVARACVDAASPARLLVTSREPLGIEGERTIAIGPLAREAAVALFEARADLASPPPRADVEALVDRLEGIPLAIELAAARAPLVSPREMLARMDELLRLLKSDRRDLPPRHATMTAALEQSFERLSEDERRAFACVALFAGPFPLEAFEHVAGPLLAGDPIDHAQALLKKSLVSARRGRLAALAIVRAFAETKLAAMEERPAAIARHRALYLARAEREAARAYGPRAEAALDALEADLADVLAAFDRAEGETAARLALALADVALFRGAIDLRAPIFARARAAADASGDLALRVRARVLESKVTLEIGAPEDAERIASEALAIAEDAAARRARAWARIARGRAEEALVDLDQALARHREEGDRRGEADALAAEGLVRALQGAHADGRALFEASLAVHADAGDALRSAKVREIAALAGIALGGEPAVVDRDQLRASAEAHRAAGRAWRAAIDLGRLAALEARDASPATRAWRVGPEARWIEPPDGARIDLARHATPRRVLAALVAHRLARPGEPLAADALLEAGWPNERVRHDSGMLRVYTTIRRLRAMGLGAALLTRDEGYLLDPELAWEKA